jgi:hypothetical protein
MDRACSIHRKHDNTYRILARKPERGDHLSHGWGMGGNDIKMNLKQVKYERCTGFIRSLQ